MVATVINAEIINQHVKAALQGVVLSGQEERNAIRDFRVLAAYMQNNIPILKVKYFDDFLEIAVDNTGFALVEALINEL